MERKVMELRDGGTWLVVKKTDDTRNPYRIYMKERNHRRQIAKYGDLFSCIFYVHQFFLHGLNAMTEEEVVRWSEESGALF